MPREDDGVQLSPPGHRLGELDTERLRIHDLRPADLLVHGLEVAVGRRVGRERLVREAKVGRGDRHAVAPARLGPNVVGEDKRPLAVDGVADAEMFGKGGVPELAR